MLPLRSILVWIFVYGYLILSTHCQCIVNPKKDLSNFILPKSKKIEHRILRPVYLDENLNFVYPSRASPDEDLKLDWSQDLQVYCPIDVPLQIFDDSRNLQQVIEPDIDPLVITCVDQRNDKAIFNIDGQEVSIDQLECRKSQQECRENQQECRKNQQEFKPQYWLDKTPQCGGYHKGKLFHLGFALNRNQKKSVLKVCYDDNRGTTMWATSIIKQGIKIDHPSHRFNWNKGNYKKEDKNKGYPYDKIDIKTYYRGENQSIVFNELFNEDINGILYEEEYTEKWIRFNGKDQKLPEGVSESFFEKGHLIANMDMFYEAEQHSTFLYANALPMWNSINAANWKVMEGYLLEIAARKGDLQVWAGGVKILKLEGREIWLGRRPDGSDDYLSERVMPVPKILFKLAYCEEKNQAIAFLALNDPYFEEDDLSDSEIICKPYRKCQEIKPEFKNIQKGYIYCCLAQDFLNSVDIEKIGLPHDIPEDVAPLV